MLLQTLRSRWLISGSIIAALFMFASLLFAPSASAAYAGGRIIDDAVFRDANTMSADQIQTFLESKNSGLKNFRPANGIECYGSDSKERELYEAAGASCSEEYLASRIIYYAARIYGVNPRVILATLQKEQSLITTTNPTSWQLSQAMGYGCPTTGDCSGSSNFAYQIDSGTWVMRYHYERANRNNSWWTPSSSWTCGTKKNFYSPNLYPRQNVTFKDGNGTSYRTHYMENAATAAFYCYTPHAYNNPKGLYGLPKYGTKGQYYTGSYNFVRSFENWFGSTRGGIQLVRATANGGIYLIDRGSKVPVFTYDALKAWDFHDNTIDVIGSESLAGYPTVAEGLTRVAKSHSSGKPYFIDSGKAHYIHSNAISAAWNLQTGDAATLNSETIDTLTKYKSLSYMIKKTGGSAVYFVENGKKYRVSSGSTRDLIRGGDDRPLTKSFSETTMNSLPTERSMSYKFKVGSQWYVIDSGKVRKIKAGNTNYWVLNGPTLSPNVLSILPVASREIGRTFRYGSKYYRIKSPGNLESTTSKSKARSWGVSSSLFISKKLFDKIK